MPYSSSKSTDDPTTSSMSGSSETRAPAIRIASSISKVAACESGSGPMMSRCAPAAASSSRSASGSLPGDASMCAGRPGALFGEIASGSTARRVLLEIGDRERDAIRVARVQARERAWAAGAAPKQVILDFDATLVTAHSDKQHAHRSFQAAVQRR